MTRHHGAEAPAVSHALRHAVHHYHVHHHHHEHVVALRGALPTGDGASRRPRRWMCARSC
jgi:hypothetical protein